MPNNRIDRLRSQVYSCLLTYAVEWRKESNLHPPD
jgi:hypothetical protein